MLEFGWLLLAFCEAQRWKRWAGGIRMAKKRKVTSVAVKDGMFFPEDFRRLHRNHVIHVKIGVIIDLDNR